VSTRSLVARAVEERVEPFGLGIELLGPLQPALVRGCAIRFQAGNRQTRRYLFRPP
jgi:hypothetical protein